MGKWIGITFLLLSVLLWGEASAQSSGTDSTSSTSTMTGAAQTAMTYCDSLRSASPNGLIAPLVHCFTDAQVDGSGQIDASASGFIPVVANVFLGGMKTYYFPVVQVMCTLVVVFFGISIVTGQVDPRRLKSEGFKMLIKIAAVFYFLSQATVIYADLLTTIQGFADSISKTAVSLVSSGFCVTTSTSDTAGAASGNLWTSWDCLLNYIFGFSGAAAISAGIISIIVMFLFSKGIGSLIFSVAVYLLLSLIFTAARFVHVYIMAVLGLSFIYCFGYIFVPLLLFKGTYQRFEKWVHMCIGYIFTPIIMLGFMGMMLVALDMVWFTGTHSITKSILGPNATSGGSTGDNAYTDAVNAQGNVKTCDLNLISTFLDNNPKAQNPAAANNPTGVDPSGQTSTACGDTSSSGNDSSSNSSSSDSSTSSTESTMENLGIPASTYLKNISATISKIKITVLELNLSQMASAAGQPDTGTYTSAVLSSIVAAALIVYIMFSLLAYIPSLASDLASSGTSVGGAFKNSKVIGEDLLRGKSPGIGTGLGGKFGQMLK